MKKKVFVSGCYDILHAGHIEFFKNASKFGKLYVSIGSDNTIMELKGRKPFLTEKERLFIIKSIRYVKDAFIAKGNGILDFKEELISMKPDFFVVNEDGDTPEKKELCEKIGTKYIVLKRNPPKGLPPRSSRELRRKIN